MLDKARSDNPAESVRQKMRDRERDNDRRKREAKRRADALAAYEQQERERIAGQQQQLRAEFYERQARRAA